jgi:hypothetical protein
LYDDVSRILAFPAAGDKIRHGRAELLLFSLAPLRAARALDLWIYEASAWIPLELLRAAAFFTTRSMAAAARWRSRRCTVGRWPTPWCHAAAVKTSRPQCKATRETLKRPSSTRLKAKQLLGCVLLWVKQ